MHEPLTWFARLRLRAFCTESVFERCPGWSPTPDCSSGRVQKSLKEGLWHGSSHRPTAPHLRGKFETRTAWPARINMDKTHAPFVMERYGRMAEMDRSFDIAYWQRLGPAAIFATEL